MASASLAGQKPRSRLLAAASGFALLAIALSAWAGESVVREAPTRWVTDDANLLSPAVREALDTRLESYERRTGHQIVAWIGATAGSEPIEVLAERTFKAWQLGRKGHDDGLLLLVLAEDRKIDIEVGYGLEDRVPDAVAHRIIDESMVPRFRAGDADGALSAGVDAILTAIEGHAVDGGPDRRARAPRGPPQPHPPSKGALLFYGILALAFLVLLITHPSLALQLLFVLSSGGGGYGGGYGGGGGGFSGGGGRSGGGGARGSW